MQDVFLYFFSKVFKYNNAKMFYASCVKNHLSKKVGKKNRGRLGKLIFINIKVFNPTLPSPTPS